MVERTSLGGGICHREKGRWRCPACYCPGLVAVPRPLGAVHPGAVWAALRWGWCFCPTRLCCGGRCGRVWWLCPACPSGRVVDRMPKSRPCEKCPLPAAAPDALLRTLRQLPRLRTGPWGPHDLVHRNQGANPRKYVEVKLCIPVSTCSMMVILSCLSRVPPSPPGAFPRLKAGSS